MAVSVECDVCGTRFRVRNEGVGKLIRCPKCDNDVEVIPEAEDLSFEGGNRGGRQRGGGNRGGQQGGQRRRPQEQRRRPEQQRRRPRASASEFDMDDDFDPRYEDEQRGGKGLMIGLLVSGGVLLLAVGIGLTIFFINKSKEDKPDEQNIAQNNPNPNLNNNQFGGNNNRLNGNLNRNRNNIGGNPGGNNNPLIGENKNPPVDPKPEEKPIPPEEQPAPEPIVWKVQPDGRDAGLRENNLLAINVEGEIFDGPIYPTAPSQFFAFGRNTRDNESLKLFNVNTGEPSGQITGNLSIRDPQAISPDGKYYAALLRSNPNREKGVFARVWSFQTGAEVQTIHISEDSGTPDLFEFAGPDKLVVAQRDGLQGKKVMLFDVTNAAKLNEFSVPRDRYWDKKEGFGVSPGGKYLVSLNQALSIYEIATGDLVGDVEITGNEPRKTWSVLDLAFSPDGTELAAIFEGSFPRRSRIISWKTQTGKPAVNLVSDKSKDDRFAGWFFYKGKKLQWLPSKTGWVVLGQFVIDHDSGEEIAKIPAQDRRNKDLRWVVDNHRILAFGSEGVKKVITTVEMHPDELDKSSKLVNAGQKAIDAKLEDLTKADLNPAPKVDLPEAVAAWNASPDPAPAAVGDLIQQPFPLSQSPSVELLFADPSQALAVALHSPEPPSTRFGRRNTAPVKGRTWLERYELNEGGSVGQVDVPAGGELLDVSPSGNVAVIRYGEEQDRLDVYSVEEGTHIVGLRPYQELEVEIRTTSSNTAISEQSVRFAGLLDDDHLLTMNQVSGKIVLWKIPEGKPVYRVETDSKQPAFLSPGGKYVCVFQDKRLRLLDSRTGKVKGDLEVPFDTQSAQIYENMVSFSPDGKNLALVARGPAVSVLLHWDLETGKFGSEIPLDSAGSGLLWAGERHLLFRNNISAYLVDLDRNAIVWRYSLFNSDLLNQGPDDRSWMLINTTNQNQKYLAALKFQDTEVTDKVESLFPKDLPPLVSPGMSVSLDIQVSGGASPNFRQKVADHLTALLKENGITVAGGQDIRLVATTSPGNSETVTYEKIGSGFPGIGGSRGTGETFTVTIQKTKCRVAFMNGQNETLWERSTVVSSGGHGYIVTIPANQDASSYLNNKGASRMGSWIESFFTGVKVPRVLYPQPRDSKGNLGMGSKTIDVRRLVNLDRVPTTTTVSAASQQQFEEMTRDYLFSIYADALGEEANTWADTVKWSDALKRPVAGGLRIGLAAEGSGGAGPIQPKAASISTSAEYKKLLGPIGNLMHDGLRTRINSGKFGTWPAYKDSRVKELTLIGVGSRRPILAAARRMAVDVLVVINFETTYTRGKKLEEMNIYFQDIHSGERIWTSKSMSTVDVARAKQAGQDLIAQLAEHALSEFDKQLTLKDYTRPNSTVATERLTAIEADQYQVNPLAQLLELRLYQEQNLLPAPKLIPLFQKRMDAGAGRDLAEGTTAQRKDAIKEWLPKFVKETKKE